MIKRILNILKKERISISFSGLEVIFTSFSLVFVNLYYGAYLAQLQIEAFDLLLFLRCEGRRISFFTHVLYISIKKLATWPM
jgi:hypothetical protein